MLRPLDYAVVISAILIAFSVFVATTVFCRQPNTFLAAFLRSELARENDRVSERQSAMLASGTTDSVMTYGMDEYAKMCSLAEMATATLAQEQDRPWIPQWVPLLAFMNLLTLLLTVGLLTVGRARSVGRHPDPLSAKA